MRLSRLMLAAVVVVSCARPSSVEQYVASGGKDAYGRYPFTLYMGDSTCSYDISLMAEIDCDKVEFASFTGFPLRVTWLSPSRKRFVEEVCLGPSALVQSSHHTRTLFSPYRLDTVPTEYGEWKMYVAVPDSLEARYGLAGMGMTVKAKDK